MRPLLTRWFARRAPSNEVDDLVQDVFLRIIKRGGTNELDHFQAYVFETASSVLKDRMRSRNVRHSDQHEEFDAERHAPSTPGAEELLISQQALELTSRILLELPERSRTIFILRRVEGLPIALIGRRLGLSVSAVEKHMQRATRHLLSRMEALR
ncbi:RNA polymerase sigma factor [Caulobacter sp. UNC279MFTsu5.1]|uniref:RNA polymerase sigma factor n=1 Tax=Caulobacter sp. UNC279MFTsu5.1 TaxID=1502775 RepID=UPI0015A6B871|nr:RNA polymerase sigma factor [Caulobacter sp. UNC279MFTsu5.1]